ncbi:Ig-like domain-containing protein [Stigmatella sp. ncwal1]|uniref:Ig-like domain-containing protein n=1 Tax=Stigmatella ashevillensis TaxID=2995309 RepID=A0ABT5D0Y0_9BACT|nr:Ig-like domain-containing protein [Stigmatella ashevillena]MDC0707318.1 Ig-like domain-containing protein [Stigmatella ashevillena]
MRRPLLVCAVLSLGGCVEPGDPLLAVRDTQPPSVVSIDPAANGQVSAAGGTVRITFSELMDNRTLRPGLAVFAGAEEIPLTVLVPPIAEEEQDIERGDIPYTVTLGAASGSFTPGTSYTLVLRTILSDYEGNALADEIRTSFRAVP